MPGRFRSKIWDPALIVSQIVSLQFQFYTTLLLINYFNSKFLGLFKSSGDAGSSSSSAYSLDQIFDHRLLNFGRVENSFVCFSFFLNSILSSFCEWRLVNRSKQCLDFTVTVFLYHVLFSWIYVGTFPSSFMFWFNIVVCSAIMTLLSEYLCMQSALREIPLSLVPKTNL